jgi:hypothetical protein
VARAGGVPDHDVAGFFEILGRALKGNHLS